MRWSGCSVVVRTRNAASQICMTPLVVELIAIILKSTIPLSGLFERLVLLTTDEPGHISVIGIPYHLKSTK